MRDFANRPAIKVCGITRSADALGCAAAGVEMIGLNFSPRSVRCLDPAAAAEIVRTVREPYPAIQFIGVFVDQPVEFVRQIATDLALDAVQLHGTEDAETMRKLKPLRIIKAFQVGPDFEPESVIACQCDAVLLDGWSATAVGGTGETFAWSIAAELQPKLPRLILAGGLTSENVAAAVAAVRPWAVDVCSGVEAAPGLKDQERVRSFVAAVRAAAEESVAR